MPSPRTNIVSNVIFKLSYLINHTGLRPILPHESASTESTVQSSNLGSLGAHMKDHAHLRQRFHMRTAHVTQISDQMGEHDLEE